MRLDYVLIIYQSLHVQCFHTLGRTITSSNYTISRAGAWISHISFETIPCLSSLTNKFSMINPNETLPLNDHSKKLEYSFRSLINIRCIDFNIFEDLNAILRDLKLIIGIGQFPIHPTPQVGSFVESEVPTSRPSYIRYKKTHECEWAIGHFERAPTCGIIMYIFLVHRESFAMRRCFGCHFARPRPQMFPMLHHPLK